MAQDGYSIRYVLPVRLGVLPDIINFPEDTDPLEIEEFMAKWHKEHNVRGAEKNKVIATSSDITVTQNDLVLVVGHNDGVVTAMRTLMGDTIKLFKQVAQDTHCLRGQVAELKNLMGLN